MRTFGSRDGILAPLAREAARRTEAKLGNIIAKSNRVEGINIFAVFKRMDAEGRTVLQCRKECEKSVMRSQHDTSSKAKRGLKQ